MAAIDWPWDLTTVLLDDNATGQDTNTRRTPFEDGAIAQHQFTTRAFDVRRIRFAVTQDNLTAAKTWFRQNGNSMFNWVDLHDGQTRDVKIRGGAGAVQLVYEPNRRLAGKRYWAATIELEGFI